MKKLLKYIEIVFRHGIVYPLFRVLLRNPIHNDTVELKSFRKMLILRDDGIGDIIVSTPMFRKLKELHPEMKLAVFASPRNVDVIRYNPFIDQIFVVHKNLRALWKELRLAKSEDFDIVINFVFNRTTSEGVLANYIAPHGLKIGQGLDQYQIYFNRLLKLQRSDKHMVEVLASVVDAIFGTHFQSQKLSVEVFVDITSHEKVNEFLRSNGLQRRGEMNNKPGSYTVINFSAVDAIRRMSTDQTVAIVETIRNLGKDTPVLIYPPNEREKLEIILSLLKPNSAIVYPKEGSATLLELASLIEGSRFVVTCDTSIVHFASAVKTPVFVLYTPTAALNHEWTPYGIECKCLFATRGLGVDSIPLHMIQEELAAFESHL